MVLKRCLWTDGTRRGPGSVSYEAREIQNAARALEELHMDTTTLLIIVVVLLLLFGGGWYGRGRWY
jgi:hypothetical protein